MRRFSPILVLSLALAAHAWANPEPSLQEPVQQRNSGTLDQQVSGGVVRQNQQLLDLLKEVETLKAEVAKMRGQAEVQAHQLDLLGKRQSDLYVDLDQRIAELVKAVRPPAAEPDTAAAKPLSATEPKPPVDPAAAVAPATPKPDPLGESRTYETALGHFRQANYAGAIVAFRGFLKDYPDSALASNAQYWIGYSYYVLKDYKTALAHQQKLVAAYPASAKVPDALLNIATSQIGLDQLDDARKTLEELVARYPGTNAANLAARRLATLK